MTKRLAASQLPRGDGVRINREIVGCNSLKELMEITQLHLQNFDNINVITTFDRISRLGPKHERIKLCNDRAFARLCQVATFKSESMTGQNLSHMVWCLAKSKLNCQNWQYLDLIQAVKTELDSRIRSLSIQKLALTSWSVANFQQLKTDTIMDKLAEAIIRRGQQIRTGHDINQLYHAFAKLRYQNSQLYEVIDKQAELHLDTFSIQEAAGVYHSLSILDRDDTKLWQKLSIFIRYHILKLDGRGIANIAWSLANIGNKDDNFLDSLKHAALDKMKMLGPDALAVFAWSLVTLDYFDRKLFDAIAKESLKQLRKFSSQNLSNLLLAYAKSNYMIPKLFDRVADATIAKLPIMQSQAVANIALSFAKLNFDSQIFIDTLLRRMNQKHLYEWKLHDLADIMYFFAKMNSCDTALLDQFDNINVDDWLKGPQPPRFMPHELIVRILWSLIVLNKHPKNIISTVLSPLFIREATTACGGALSNEMQCQLHQIALSVDWTNLDLNSNLDLLHSDLIKYRQTFSSSAQSSLSTSYSFHMDVFAALKKIIPSEFLRNEYITPFGYTTDLYFETDLSGIPLQPEDLQAMNISYAPLPNDNRRRNIIEVDGKTHFLRNSEEYTGSSRLKSHHLEKFGYNVIQIPFFEWATLESSNGKVQYLNLKLGRDEKTSSG